MKENINYLDIISSFKEKRILVIGDIIVDCYIRGTVNEIAEDAPIPVVNQYSGELFLGGALNLARCIRALQGHVCLCSVVGNDDEGKFVCEKSKNDLGMDIDGIFIVDKVNTTLITRVLGNNQHMIRIQRDIKASIIDSIQEKVESYLKDHNHKFDAIVIADYNKGFITPSLIDFIVKFFGKDIPIVVSPILNHFNYYNDVTAVILHRRTAEKLLQISMLNETSIRNSGLRILRMLNPQVVLITWIQEGFHLFTREGDISYFPCDVKDDTLLGYRDINYRDTVTSVFAFGLTLNIDLKINTQLTLKAADFYVSRARTYEKPITYEEFLEYLKNN